GGDDPQGRKPHHRKGKTIGMNATNTSVLETKSAGASDDIGSAFEDFMTSFEAFKDANDERLGQIERRMADPITSDKVDRISRALDEQKKALDTLSLKKARPSLGRGDGSPVSLEHKEAFE